MKAQSRYNFFWWIAALLFLINVLVMNDVTTIWKGAEFKMVQVVSNSNEVEAIRPSAIPYYFIQSVYKNKGLHQFGLRLPGAIALFLTALGFYFFGKKIFGKETVLTTMLVLAASFLIPTVAKIAVSDIWLMGAQLLSLITLVLFIKQPQSKWAYWWGICFLVGLLTSPISMLIWTGVLVTYLFFLHPQGHHLKNSYFYGVLLIPLLILTGFQFWQWNDDLSLLKFGELSIPEYAIYLLVGLLPWLGFLPAALWDQFKKIKSKEELAIINLGWLIAGLMSFSLVVECLLAFLIAKTILAYFHKNYPYKRIVKLFTLLSMVLTFILVFSVLMGGAFKLNAAGYRLFLAVGIVYWISTFVGIIGLFGYNKPIVIGGISIGALLSFYLFWMQVNPVMETSRSTAQRWTKQATTMTEGRSVKKLTVDVSSFSDQELLKLYAKEKGIREISILSKNEAVSPPFEQQKNEIFILDQSAFLQLQPILNNTAKIDSAATRLQLFGTEEMIYFITKK